jgi:hypothetical protein
VVPRILPLRLSREKFLISLRWNVAVAIDVAATKLQIQLVPLGIVCDRGQHPRLHPNPVHIPAPLTHSRKSSSPNSTVYSCPSYLRKLLRRPAESSPCCAPFSALPISRRNSPAIPYARLPKGTVQRTPLTPEDGQQQIQEYVEHYTTGCLHSAIGFVTPADMLAGRQAEIHTARDRKLEEARQQRQRRRQQPASLSRLD